MWALLLQGSGQEIGLKPHEGLLPYLQQAKQRMHDLMANGATPRRSAAEEMEEDRKGGREEGEQNMTG